MNGDMPAFPASAPLAMAYVPFQNWGDTKSPEDALDCGTLFSDLVYPFEKGGGNR
ncbi:MAG: spore coat associated protein CotJA [Ruminococcus sp.]|nr:spore coat associated protein CotJA [Ruminococcus sp.]MBR3970872.1 spore coat associated protein CotJA [Ruminococcus sp.]